MFGAVTLLTLGFANCCLAVGAWVLIARVIGLCLSCIFGCVNFAAIITIGVFRFNPFGQLAAMSDAPSKFESIDGPELTLSDKRTYKIEALMITVIWAFQLILCCCGCLASCVLNKNDGGNDAAARNHGY